MQLCMQIPKRRHLMLKETSLAKHCLLVLRSHANFSSLFSSPLSTNIKNVCCKNLMLSGTMHSLLFFFPPRALHIHCTERLSESKNSLSHNKVSRSSNTAECHQSQLSRIQSENGSLQRAFDLLESCLYSTGSWEIFGEKLSCIAQWRHTHELQMGTDAVCCMPLMKLYLAWPDNSENRLHQELWCFFV